ncbi:MAG: ErfK/YbiS/YcfS/YnhG family protein [uncultured bacterium]|nr:MAG: ErfK/YbiS/YcfS/YnhG family protein [uncultured bacterium]
MIFLKIDLSAQTLGVFKNDNLVKRYFVSTGKNGAGELMDSGKTPRGLHIIRAKIGARCPVNTVFVSRRPSGEIFSEKLRAAYPDRDWILTRILWLSGLEIGKNRLGKVDTMRRYIYIHGSPDDVLMGSPGSKGCIRMRNQDIIELFDTTPIRTEILLE